MTEKLFDIDGCLLEFDAKVLSCEAIEGGFAAVLDRTAFAPEGGGQLSDVGVLGGAAVLDVRTEGDEILHVVDKSLTVGDTVHGVLDRDRRVRHIQNHTGEHIVSGLFYTLYGYTNIGFHLGSEDVTMDLDGEVSEDMLRRVEREANRVVFEDHPVTVTYPDTDTLAGLSYRAKLDLSENVRIVTIEGVDACACCAPHVARTGQIGMIKLLYAIRYKGGTRIHMKCGFDALDEFNAEFSRATAISNRISLPRERIAEGVDKLWTDLSEANYRIVGLRRELIACRAEAAVATDGNLLFIEKDMDANDLRLLVTLSMDKASGACAAFSEEQEGVYRFVAAYRGNTFDEWRAALCDAIHGRGGGKAPFIQGKANCTEAEIRAFFEC